MLNRVNAALFAAAWLCLTACTDTQFEQATGQGQIRGINAIANADQMIFLIEERELGQLDFKAISGNQPFDNLSYTFNFDLPILFEADRRIARQFVDVIEDIEYTLVLAGSINSPDVLLWERPEPTWDGTETVFEVGVGHASTTAGELDVYLLEPGNTPTAGAELGTVAFGAQLADVERSAGDFQLFLTTAGDPSDVRFMSSEFPVGAADTYTLAIFDADPTTTGDLNVRFIDTAGQAAELADERFAPTIQFVHAAFGTGSVDIVAGDDFAAPLVSGLTAGQFSGDVETELGAVTYTVAPAGNTMSLLDVDVGVAPGTRSLFVLVGPPGELQFATAASERRGLSSVGLLRVTNGTNDAGALDVYLTEPGEGIADNLPSIIGLPFGVISGVLRQVPDSYDLTVTPTGDSTPIAGPISVTVGANDFIEVFVLDTADPNAASVTVFSNVNP